MFKIHQNSNWLLLDINFPMEILSGVSFLLISTVELYPSVILSYSYRMAVVYVFPGLLGGFRGLTGRCEAQQVSVLFLNQHTVSLA